jgi:hypothetical protein
MTVLAVLMFVLGATAVGLVFTAGLGLGIVGLLFCDAPGSTTMDCVLSGAEAGVIHTAPYLLPVAGVALLLGLGFHRLSRSRDGRAGVDARGG